MIPKYLASTLLLAAAAAASAQDTVAPIAAPPVLPAACNAPSFENQDAAALDRSARALAGLPVEGLPEAQAAAFAAHAAQLDAPFRRLDGRQLKAVREWSVAELAPLTGPVEALYYPFSGPDVLYATALFPQAQRMLFTGLETVGELPQTDGLAAAELASSLAELRRSLASLLGKSFFVTAQMQAQFGRNRFEGVTPILMLLLARSGYQVEAVAAVALGADGRLCARGFADKLDDAGVELRYRKPGEATARSLVYLRTDLSNDGLAKAPQYATLVRSFAPAATYLKSASYLMHGRGFSSIRELILDVSPQVLQDDSGIPYRAFAASAWQPTLFGRYVRGGGGFANAVQPDLVRAFAAAPQRPLPFWIGYRSGPADSNLQLYVRRPAASAAGVAP